MFNSSARVRLRQLARLDMLLFCLFSYLLLSLSAYQNPPYWTSEIEYKLSLTVILYAKNQDAVRCFGNQPKSCVDEELFSLQNNEVTGNYHLWGVHF